MPNCMTTMRILKLIGLNLVLPAIATTISSELYKNCSDNIALNEDTCVRGYKQTNLFIATLLSPIPSAHFLENFPNITYRQIGHAALLAGILTGCSLFLENNAFHTSPKDYRNSRVDFSVGMMLLNQVSYIGATIGSIAYTFLDVPRRLGALCCPEVREVNDDPDNQDMAGMVMRNRA